MMTLHDDTETHQVRRKRWQVGIAQQEFKFYSNESPLKASRFRQRHYAETLDNAN